jgi:D-aminopeptidase
MKVHISVDIEGVAGITHWDEAEKTHRDYPEFREQMTREAIAAIEGATMTPKAAIAAIRQGAEAALKGDPGESRIALPDHFVLEVTSANPVWPTACAGIRAPATRVTAPSATKRRIISISCGC